MSRLASLEEYTQLVWFFDLWFISKRRDKGIRQKLSIYTAIYWCKMKCGSTTAHVGKEKFSHLWFVTGKQSWTELYDIRTSTFLRWRVRSLMRKLFIALVTTTMHELFACVNNGRRARNRANKISVFYSGGSSTKSLRPQPKKVGGWLMPSLRKSPSI